LLQLVITHWGWRSGYLALALAVGPLLIPLILLFQKSHPAQMGLKPFERKLTPSGSKLVSDQQPPVGSEGETGLGSREVVARLLGSRRFWACLAQLILGPLSTMPIVMHQAALLQGKGMSSMGSAWVVGVYGLAVFCGMILSGTLSDRIGREWSYTLGSISLLAGTVFLLSVRSGTGLVLPFFYAVFFGLGYGTRPSMDSATAADVFKGRHFGLIYGILQLGLGIGSFFGPILGGLIYDRSGSYSAALVFCMAAVVVATGCIWTTAPRHGREQALV
jgi:MFS family permease